MIERRIEKCQKMNGELVVLVSYDSIRKERPIHGQYYLDYTGNDLRRAIQINFKIPEDPTRKVLLQGINTSKILNPDEKIRNQGIASGDTVILVDPDFDPNFMTEHVKKPVKTPLGVFSQDIQLDSKVVKLSDFQKLRSLGSGGFGSVYCARDTITEKLVAIKELTCDFLDDKNQLFFQREVEILARLQHPTVMSLYGFTKYDPNSFDKPAIITQYMENGSLDDVIKNEYRGLAPPGWSETKRFINVYGIVAGMVYLHDNRIIHRDLKALNIMIDDQFEPKISDFGLSKFVALGQTIYQTTHKGTPYYMAPEIYEGEDYDGFKSDVYAFGMMLYVIYTGVEPWTGIKSPMILMRKVMEGSRPTIPEDVPKCIAQLIERCWDSNPLSRPTFREMILLLETEPFLQGIDIVEFEEYRMKVAPPDLVKNTNNTAPKQSNEKPKSAKKKLKSPKSKPVKRVDNLKKMADDGDAYSQNLLGCKLRDGDGYQKNEKQAVNFFKMAADQGYLDGIVNYAVCLMDGIGTTQDFQKANEYFKRAMEKGDLDAKYHFARALRFGKGINRDEILSEKLMKEAADAGHAEAQNEYGRMCELGKGRSKNIQEAVKYYKMSSDNACPLGMFNYADMFHHARYVEKNMNEAIRLYKLAADNSELKALFALSLIYQNGEGGVPVDSLKAAECAKMGVDRNSFYSLIQYADLLEKGIGVNSNKAEAEKLRKIAFSREFAKDQCDYANMYSNGKGVNKDYNKAFQFYKISAENGLNVAKHNLGVYYHYGTGCNCDIFAAIHWYRSAADEEYEPSIISYAKLMESDQNYKEAFKYYMMGVEKDNADCMIGIGSLYESGRGVAKSLENAARFYKNAAEKMNPYGYFHYGRMLEYGLGTNENPLEAARYYNLAINFDIPYAYYTLGLMYNDGRGVPFNKVEAIKLLTIAKNKGVAVADNIIK